MSGKSSKKRAKNRGRKDDLGKPDHTMYPKEALDMVALVLMHGEKKYGRLNFNQVKNGRNRYTRAALRHLFSDNGGETVDSESGLYHLAHATCSCLMALHFAIQENKKK